VQVLSLHFESSELEVNASGNTPAADQINDQDYQRNHQQQMNQAARYVEAEPKKPQN
jgi:hypothetical protein